MSSDVFMSRSCPLSTHHPHLPIQSFLNSRLCLRMGRSEQKYLGLQITAKHQSHPSSNQTGWSDIKGWVPNLGHIPIGQIEEEIMTNLSTLCKIKHTETETKTHFIKLHLQHHFSSQLKLNWILLKTHLNPWQLSSEKLPCRPLVITVIKSGKRGKGIFCSFTISNFYPKQKQSNVL